MQMGLHFAQFVSCHMWDRWDAHNKVFCLAGYKFQREGCSMWFRLRLSFAVWSVIIEASSKKDETIDQALLLISDTLQYTEL